MKQEPSFLLEEGNPLGLPQQSVTMTPIINLWLAVFRLGVSDYVRFPDNARYRGWVWSMNRTPGSFIWLCELFNIDPQQALRGLRAQEVKDEL